MASPPTAGATRSHGLPMVVARDGAELIGLLDPDFPLAVVELDADLCITYWSAAAQALFGCTADVIGSKPQRWPFLVPGEDIYAMTALHSLTAHVPRRKWIGQCVRPDGNTFYVQWFFAAICDPDGQLSGYYVYASSGAAAELAPETAHELTFEATTVGVAHVSTDAVIRRVNTALADMLGYRPEEMVGKTVADITYPDDLAGDEAQMAKVIAEEFDKFRLEKRYVRKDGTVFWVSLTVSSRRAPGGALLHFISVVEDIDARKQMESKLAAATAATKALADRADQLADLVRTDTLTDLNNRRGLTAWLESLQPDEPMALLFVDLDGFKQINDSFGHAVGDAVLRVCADRLAQSCRRDDLAARLGGDEFVIGLLGVTADTRNLISERVRTLIAEPIDVDGHRLRVSASIGVVERRVGESAEELLSRADSAMYRAKLAGGDRLSLGED